MITHPDPTFATTLLDAPAAGFCLDPTLLAEVLAHAKPLGHHEQPERLNLGFGFMYYSLVRALRPQHIVVIGSGFGFSVTCLALGLRDNEAGQLTFVDPSYSLLRNGPFKTIGGVNNWRSPDAVQAHFARFGVADFVHHHKMTSEAFFANYEQADLPPIDLAFIDGNHAYKHVKHDFLATLRHSHKNTYVLLHDTAIVVREFIRHSGVKRWLKALRSEKDAFEFVDFPFDSGVAIVRVVEPTVWQQAS